MTNVVGLKGKRCNRVYLHVAAARYVVACDFTTCAGGCATIVK